MNTKKDGTSRLGQAVYGREPTPKEWVGGSEAKLLHDAADEIERLKEEIETLHQDMAGEDL